LLHQNTSILPLHVSIIIATAFSWYRHLSALSFSNYPDPTHH